MSEHTEATLQDRLLTLAAALERPSSFVAEYIPYRKTCREAADALGAKDREMKAHCIEISEKELCDAAGYCHPDDPDSAFAECEYPEQIENAREECAEILNGLMRLMQSKGIKVTKGRNDG